MKYLLTGSEMADADRLTSEKIGIPSIVLMERAALSVADEITERFSVRTGVTVLAGPGNNGADGLAAGRILIDRGYRVQFLLLSPKAPAADSSMMIQRRILNAYGEEPQVFSGDRLRGFSPDVIVDALFGTGLGRPLEGRALEIADAVNRYRAETGCTVVGLDLPSGISSDDGSVMGAAVKCDLTVTFAYYKRGHFLYPGSSYCGETILKQIGIHDRSLSLEGPAPAMIMPERPDAAALVRERQSCANKGTFGKILIAAGSYSMCGAALLSAEACMRAGAGMVKVFTREENRVIMQEKLPEALLSVYGPLPEKGREREAAEKALAEKMIRDLRWADAAVIGPGIGRNEEARVLVRTLLKETAAGGSLSKQPEGPLRAVVIDADALRLIASDPEMDRLMRERDERTGCILTPHIAEFADLSHVTVKEAQAERISLMRSLAERYTCTVIGKDARTLITSAGERRMALITNGNSGMATAGSGDVLTGITAAMLFAVGDEEGQAMRAAEAAAYIHAEAGRICKEQMGEHAMLAGDLVKALGAAIRSITAN